MANSTIGSHGGSFAGGFAKAFLAVMQMSMRKRQLDDMHEFYEVMKQQMRMNMNEQGGRLRIGEEGKDAARRRLEGISSGTGETTGKYSVAEMTKMAEKAGFKGNDAVRMAAIAAAESNGNPDAKGKAGEVGLTQVNPHDWSAEDVAKAKDSQGAFDVAYKIYQKQGWGAWSTDPTSKNFTPKNSMEQFYKPTSGQQASAIDTRDSSSAKNFLASISAHPDRPGDTSNMHPEFATRLASAIKQANAEGIPVKVASGYRDPDQLLRQGDRSQAAYFDAAGNSKHSDGTASDVSGIGRPGSATAHRWAEIADANGLSVPYGANSPKEWNHTELAGETRARGWQPYRVAGDVPIPPPESSYAPAIPIGGGKGNELQAPRGVEAPTAARTPEMLTPLAGGAQTDPRLQPAPTVASAPAPAPVAAIPTRGQTPPAGLVQSNVGGVRGQQPGAGGPIYTAGQFGPLTQSGQPTSQPTAAPPAPTLPATTGVMKYPLTAKPIDVGIPATTPLPPPRPADLSGAETDTSGSTVPTATPPTSAGGSNIGMLSADPLWAGYAGASPDQAASADPLNNMYSSTDTASAASGLTDTSGLMAAGMMSNVASAEDSDLTATMYRGGPVVRYRMGGVINRYAGGGGTDEDLLGEYGGTDTDDPMANTYWDQQRVAGLTNNSDPGATPDLTTSILNRAAQPSPQDQSGVQLPPSPTEGLNIGEPPATTQPAAPTDQPTTEQPAAPPSEEPTAPQPTDQPTSQSDIPPGSVQVAGPGGWGSAGSRELTHISMPRVGGMGGGGGMRGPRPSMSMGRGRAISGSKGIGGQPLYTPGYISDEDYNHLGVAPTHNSDGSPGVWLMNMVDNGVRALFTGFGFANQGAMPGSPQASQNLDHFLNNDSNSMPSRQDMKNLGKLYDPHGDFIDGAAEIGGAVSMIKYYALTGQLDAASRLSGGVLLYTRMMSMEYGDEAVKSLFNGDYKNAVKSLEQGYNWVPDAKTAKIKDIDEKTGKVTAQQRDGNGNVIAEQDYLPAAIMKAALGLKDGTGYWSMLGSLARAGGNDPMGSHYETQRILRGIEGNQNVPLPPLASQAAPKDGTIPINGAPPTGPDTTIPTDDTQPPPTPDTQSAPPPDTTAPPDQAVTPPVPSRGDINATVGQAAPPPTAAPPAPIAAIPNRGDASNLVAGPGAPSTVAANAPPTAPGGSGATLIAQEKIRQQQVQQSQAIDRMVHGGTFDGDDPYVQQKIADIQNRNIVPLQKYRTQMEQQFADIEGADISPAEKKSLQVALAAKIKNFDETSLKPAIATAKQEYGQFSSGLKQQFTAKMQLIRRQEKLQDEAITEEKTNIAGQVKYREQRNMDDEQFNLYDGIDKGGKLAIDPTTGERIYGYGDSLSVPFNATRTVTTGTDANGKATTATIPVNPLATYSQHNPYLSSSYDGKSDDTFDAHTIKTPEGEPLFTPSNINTAVDAGKDMLKYDKGVDTRMVKDFVSGVVTGGYTIDLQRFDMPHPALPLTHEMAPDVIDKNNRVMLPDKTDRVSAIIRRSPDDPGTTVVMSKAMGAKLRALNLEARGIVSYNKSMIEAKNAPLDRPIPQQEPPPTPLPPRNAVNSQQQQPPRQTPTPLTPNTIPQTNYDIPPDAPTVGSTVMDAARWLKSHGIISRGQPQPNPFR